MALALSAVTDTTRSSAIAMTGPKTFIISQGSFSGEGRIKAEIQVSGSSFPPIELPPHMIRVERDRFFTLDLYGVDLFLSVVAPNGSPVSIEYT